MSLPSSLIWEIRPAGSGASDNNGGGFDPSVSSPGSDYSQQDSPQVAYSDLVIGATTTQLTSATTPFTSAHVGNNVQITGGTGFTTGVYNVRSVSGSTATMDRAVGTAASTGGTGNLGGALASLGMAAGVVVGSNDVWVKAGTYSIGSGTANTSGNRITWAVSNSTVSGYSVTRGDDVPSNYPVLQAAAGSMTLFGWSGSPSSCVITKLKADGNGQTSIVGISGTSRSKVLRCVAVNCATAFLGSVDLCYADTCTTGFTAGTSALCVARACGTGFTNQISANCIALSGTIGFSDAASVGRLKSGCTAYGNSSHGFAITGDGVNICANNVSYLNGGKGFSGTVDADIFLNNAAGANTSGTDNSPVTLTANPFDTVAIAAITDLASAFAAFRPNSAAGGGALLRGAGIIPYADIGASQHQDSGGGSTIIVIDD